MADKKTEIKKLQLKVDQVSRTQSILNQNQIQKIFNTTPKKYQYQRPGKADGQWSYVRVSYVRRTLDGLFGFDWDFTIQTSLAEAYDVAKITGTCVVLGRLTGRTKIDGEIRPVIKDQFGRAEVKFKKGTRDPLDFGNDMKAAASDSLKKCASLLGIAADVYDPEEFIEIEIIGSDENSERQKNLKSKVKEAQKILKTQAKEVNNG